MTHAILQGFWHGPPLGALRQMCLTSFAAHGHEFHLYVYDEVHVPPGIRLRDANRIVPKDELFWYSNPHTGKPDLGPFSDLFRFKLLSTIGGWWSDVDTLCLTSDIPTFDRAWAGENPEYRPEAVGTSQIAFPAADKVVCELYRRCLSLSRTDFQPREALGPHLISQTIADMGLPRDMNGTADTFYPVRWIEIFKLWLPEFRSEVERKAKGALFMPIYQSFPQYIGLQFHKYPPKGSYLGDQCDKYFSESDSSNRHEPGDIRQATRQYFLKYKEWALDELGAVSGPVMLQQAISVLGM